MRILLVVSRFPWPPRRGDQLRTVQAIEALAGEHELTVLAPAPPPSSAAPPLPCRLITYRARAGAAVPGLARAVAWRLPLQSALFFQPDLRRQLRQLAPVADLGILQLARLGMHVGDFGSTPVLVDLIDSLSLNLDRRAAVDRHWVRPLLRLEARRLSREEQQLLARAVGGLVVCDRDRLSLLRRANPGPEAARRLAVVPIAVPQREDSGIAVGGIPVGERPLITLTGNLGYFVNDDATRWFLDQVWPALGREAPELRLVVAGDRPRPSLRRRVVAAGAELLASPADLGQLLAGAAVSVAPMRCGSGVPIKVLEAWSAGVPVVASPWAAAGTSGVAGEDFLVVERPAEWRRAILGLIRDQSARRRLAENGRQRLIADHAIAVVRRRLLAAVAAAAAGRGPAAVPAASPR